MIYQKKNEQLESRVTNYQKESIAILGIFTSIVVTFISGGIISSSILENIGKVSINNLISALLSLGIIIFNILITLYYFIIKIADIRSNKAKHKLVEYKYLIIPNIIFIFLLLLVLFKYGI